MVTKNIVFYADAKQVSKTAFCGGGCGYDYDISVEGKKKLKKDVPTTQGYYVSTECKVVDIDNIINIIVGKQKDIIAVYALMLNALLETLINSEEYSRIMFYTKYKFIQALFNLKADAINPGYKLGKIELTKESTRLIKEMLELHKQAEEKGKKLIVSMDGFVEAGLGVKLAVKQRELGEVLAAANKSKISFHIENFKEYSKPEVDFNGLVTGNRWYFDMDEDDTFYKTRNDYRVYAFGAVDKDKKYYGKFTPDVTYSKLYTKEPITLLDEYYDFSKKTIPNEEGFLLAGVIDKLKSKDAVRLSKDMLIEENGCIFSPITFQGSEPLLIEKINPVMMSYRVREFLSSIDIIFDTFINREKGKPKNIDYYDITHLFYEVTENKKGVKKLGLSKDFPNGTVTVKFPVSHPNAKVPVPLTLSVGYDTPDRNGFNKVTDVEVKVWLVTDTSNDKGIRYTTIVETNEYIYIQVGGLANLRVLSLKELK